MAVIVAQQPEPTTITFGNWPLEAETNSVRAIAEPIYALPESLFETKRCSTAVLIEVRSYDSGPICLGSSEELTGKMEELAGEGEKALVWKAVKHCRNFVKWRNEAEARIAGGVAA